MSPTGVQGHFPTINGNTSYGKYQWDNGFSTRLDLLAVFKVSRYFRQLSLGALLLATRVGHCQSSTRPANSDRPPPIQQKVSPCAQPAQVFDVHDYNGPLNRLVARITNKLEIKTAHSPRLNQQVHLCALTARQKFMLFVHDSFEPVNFLDAGWDSGWAQLSNDDPSFGQGAAGYGKRYGAALADNFSGDFFNTFFYPTLFRQDPRYYRIAHGPVRRRLLHAARQIFVAYSDSGHPMPNFSEWLGAASAKALGNLYHPDSERGFGTTAQRTGITISTDMAWNVAKEFWPEISRKLRLPFRVKEHEGEDPNGGTAHPAKGRVPAPSKNQ